MPQPAITRQITIEPIVKYPRVAQVGQTYLLTIDLRPQLAAPDEWPYEEEEYTLHCILDSLPLFSHEPVGEPVVVVHRFGGSYGPASFLLTAAEEEMTGGIRVTLVNEWGLPVDVLELEGIHITAQLNTQDVRYFLSRKPDPIGSIIGLYLKGKPQETDKKILRRQVTDYLRGIYNRFSRLELRGIRRDGQQVIQLELEQMYVPLAAEVHRRGSQAEEIRLDQVLQQGKRIIITGGSGSGKTTILLQIALTLALSILNNKTDLVVEKLGLKGIIPLPVFIPLSSYARYRRELPLDVPVRRGMLADFISHHLIRQRQGGFDLPDDFFQQLFNTGKQVMLLLDGLDEIPEENERTAVRQAIEDFVTGRPELYVVATSRVSAYQGKTLLRENFREVTVLPLTRKHIEQLIQRVYLAYDLFDNRISATQSANDLIQAVDNIETQRRQAYGEGTEPLFTTPLLVRILMIVHLSNRRLPQQRAELYKEATDNLLLPTFHPDQEVVQELGGLVGGSHIVHRELTQYLAFELHQRGQKQGRELQEYELRQILQAHSSYSELADDFIHLARSRSTLLEERAGQYRFIHLAFQEFLVASYLVDIKMGEEGYNGIVAFLEQGPLLDNWWREPILLISGYLGVQKPQTAQNFLRRLAWLDEHAEERDATLPSDIPLAAAELAGAAALEWPGLPSGLVTELSARLAEFYISPDRLDNTSPMLRIRASQTLGRLGDPREGVATLPPALTSTLEGEFRYGDQQENRKVSPFQGAIYPITNAQYVKFIEASGYAEPRWWSTEGWQWKNTRDPQHVTQPRYWNDQRFNHSNQPVVGVSWYEAEAFCNWLSADTGETYRLPTEEEWERMARGQHGWLYPWGNQWQDGLANTEEMGLNYPSAVGIFPAGASPTGCLDCAGNVWEWTASQYDTNQPSNVLRGGTFNGPAEYAACTFRFQLPPNLNGKDVGFRVVQVPTPKVDDYGWRFVRKISPTEQRLVEIQAIVDELHENVFKLGKEGQYSDVIMYGSVARGTALEPIADIDILTLLTLDPSQTKPDIAFNMTKQLLTQIYQRNVKRSPKARRSRSFGASTIVELGNGFRLEITPAAVSPHDKEILIPDWRLQKWTPSYHEQHAKAANLLDQQINGQFKTLVKLIKHWQYYPHRRKFFSSFVVECLVADNLPENHTDLLEAFQFVLQQFRNRYVSRKKIMYVPILGVPHKTRSTGIRDNVRYQEFMNHIDDTLRRIQQGQQSKSLAKELEYWQQIFGQEFID